jgi:hypothetical protein
VARSSVEASRAAGDTGISDEERWQAQRPYLDELMSGGDIPLLSRVGAAGGFEGSAERTFGFGLERILDGIEALIEALIEARRRPDEPDRPPTSPFARSRRPGGER